MESYHWSQTRSLHVDSNSLDTATATLSSLPKDWYYWSRRTVIKDVGDPVQTTLMY